MMMMMMMMMMMISYWAERSADRPLSLARPFLSHILNITYYIKR